GKQKTAFVRVCIYTSGGLLSVFENNRKELSEIDKPSRIGLLIIIIVQVLFYLYYLCETPVQFDEWYSYYFFSGDSLWKTMTYYPVPNNHIFSNLIAGLFLKLPFDQEVLMRLPSFFASL